MRIAILDAFSGISGDMTLGALLDVGLDEKWLTSLPHELRLDGVSAVVRDVVRAGIKCKKVDFEIPPQPHGRHLSTIRKLVGESRAPVSVRERADAAFTAIATVEGEIHGVPPEKVHLHEVGAVDAILDVVGSIWGFELLGVRRIYCSAIALGDGTVQAAHGTLPVPAPATLKLLEGQVVRSGPEHSGELVTPTGAALVRTLSAGPPPAEYTPIRSGFGAGTKEFADRPNALRMVLADHAVGPATTERLLELVCDIDDMTPEYVAAAADRAREEGALDVTLVPVTMKRGRPGTRIEVLCAPGNRQHLEQLLLVETSSIGVRCREVERRALPRESRDLDVLGHAISAKVVELPNGERRIKPEFADVQRVALATGRPLQDIFRLAAAEAERS